MSYKIQTLVNLHVFEYIRNGKIKTKDYFFEYFVMIKYFVFGHVCVFVWMCLCLCECVCLSVCVQVYECCAHVCGGILAHVFTYMFVSTCECG